MGVTSQRTAFSTNIATQTSPNERSCCEQVAVYFLTVELLNLCEFMLESSESYRHNTVPNHKRRLKDFHKL